MTRPRLKAGATVSTAAAATVVFVAFLPLAAAQQQRIVGRVIDPATNTGMAGVRVRIAHPGAVSTPAVVTDAEGRFTIAPVPTGRVLLVAQLDGFESSAPLAIVVQPEQRDVIVDLPYPLRMAASVSAESRDVSLPEGTSIAATAIARRELLARAGVLDDVSRALQTQPGVAASQDGRNDLIVRGGASMETRIRVDGFDLPNPNHFASQDGSGGGIGMIAPWVIDRALVQPGGFSVAYGEGASGVVDLTLRSGDPVRLSGAASAGPGGAMLAAGGRVGGRGSWIASARRSLLEIVFSRADARIVPRFADGLFKLELGSGAPHRVTMLGVASADGAKVKSTRSNATTVEARQHLALGGIRVNSAWDARTSSTLVASVGRGDVNAVGLDGQRVNAIDRTHEVQSRLRAELRHRRGPRLMLHAGAGVTSAGLRAELEEGTSRNAFGLLVPAVRVNHRDRLTDASGFLEVALRPARRWQMVAGVRADRPGSSQALRASPRGRLEYTIGAGARLSGVWGIYRQPLPYIWLVSHPRNRTLDWIRSDQRQIGIELTPRAGARLFVEAFDKRYAGYPIDPTEPSRVLVNVATDFVAPFVSALVPDGRVHARGLDAAVYQRFGRAVMLGAGWSRWAVSQQGLDRIWRAAEYDLRHQVRLDATTRFASGWGAAARWRYATGRAYTPFNAASSIRAGAGRFDLGLINAARYPSYHRLDARIDREMTWRRARLAIFAEVNNAYDRTNVYLYKWDRASRAPRPILQWGLTPSGGIRIEF